MMKLLKTGNSRVAVLKQQRGMTLFELLGVLIVLGIVAAIAIPAVSGVITQSEADADVRTRERVANQAEFFINARDINADCLLDSDTTKSITTVVGTVTVVNCSSANKKVVIKTSYLVSQGYLREVAKDQVNNKDFSDVLVTYTTTGTSSGVWKVANLSTDIASAPLTP